MCLEFVRAPRFKMVKSFLLASVLVVVAGAGAASADWRDSGGRHSGRDGSGGGGGYRSDHWRTNDRGGRFDRRRDDRGGWSAGQRTGGGFRGRSGGRAYAPRYFGAPRVRYRGSYGYSRPAPYYGRPYAHRSHTYFGFGLSLGDPGYYYAPPTHVYVEPAPVYVDPAPTYDEDDPPPADDREPAYDDQSRAPSDDSGDIDVTNEPPAGCYYYDPFCEQRFSNLDEYTHHLESRHHAQTIDVIEKDGRHTLRTLEFVDGYWQVQESR